MRRIFIAVIISFLSLTLAVAQAKSARERLERGNRAAAREQYLEALSEYQSVTDAPTDLKAVLRYNIGVCYYHLARTQDAVAEYRSAINLRGGRYPKASYALGMVLAELGDLQGAILAFQDALRLSHDGDAEAAFDLAMVLAREGKYDAAASRFRQAIQRRTRSLSAAHNNLGVMIALTGHLSEAATEFEIAQRLAQGSSIEVKHNLRLCNSWLVGSPEGARTNWRLMNSVDGVLSSREATISSRPNRHTHD